VGCVGGEYLKAVVTSAAVDEQVYSFCGGPAARSGVFMVGVRSMFEQAGNAGVPCDGGYVFTTYERHEPRGSLR
jgi:hypothetical protein